MKIVFLSNYFNHHQKPFCDAMASQPGVEFAFIATSEMRPDRQALGYGMEEIPAYVHKAHADPAQRAWCQNCIDMADAVIFGSAPYAMIHKRLKAGGLTFLYSERIYKKKCPGWQIPLRALKYYWNYGRFGNLYLLCASGYAASDYAMTGTFLGRAYRWGYFPEVRTYDIDALLAAKTSLSLLWVGRFLDWKHPEQAVLTAKRLKEDGTAFQLNMIGTGPMEQSLKAMIAEYHLEDCVHLLGSMKPDQVRIHMERAQIFLFTSDRNEGWGAVLNEAMNSGCAVVASDAIGSVPFLLNHGRNGMIFHDGASEELYGFVRDLLEHAQKQRELGRAAYAQMRDLWNAECAAERILGLAGELWNHTPSGLYADGPCSRI